MEITPIRTPGLGDTSYLVTHAGMAIMVDPQRDIDRFEDAIPDGVALRLVLETHLHNDYLSGGRDLASRTGAELVMPAGAAAVFRHRPAFHMEDIDLGEMSVRPLHTPGHTPEHTSYLILVEGEDPAVFSGGSLLAGSAGRTDLLGWERAETLARLQYGSVRRLAALPDETRLCPTHGAGSFCTSVPAGRAQSTVGEERSSSPVLAHDDEESFVIAQLSGLPPYPTYYRHMAPLNLAGVLARLEFDAPMITPSQLVALGDGVTVVDARRTANYARGHIPGSLSIELKGDFGVWVGWSVPFGTPIALVLDPGQDLAEAIRQLSRIGYDEVRGVLRGLDGWEGELASFEVADVAAFAEAAKAGAQVLDTRAPSEWKTGTIGGSNLVYVPDVAHRAGEVLDRQRPVWVACASGFRAGIAASLLSREGFEPILLVDSGVTEVIRRMSDD